MKCILEHSWGFPQREGYRDSSGKFIPTGLDIQTCTECGEQRESPVQFDSKVMVKGA